VTEKLIESAILDWLNLQPKTFAFKVNTVGVFDPKRRVYRTNRNPHLHNGTSDILGLHDQSFFAIEVKYNKGRPTANQKSFIKKVEDAGGRALVAWSLKDVQDAFALWFTDDFKLINRMPNE
jgi:hypothetical protein